MVDITFKNKSLRTAVATATVEVSLPATIQAVEQSTVPKGDVFAFGRAAGLLGIKRTSDVIPDCHPLPIEYANISYTISGLEIIIEVEVKAIYRTGIEVEAMHGASVTALTLYDMLKPIDPSISIKEIRLAAKSGGKKDRQPSSPAPYNAAVIICSDSVHSGTKEDKAAWLIEDRLSCFNVHIKETVVIPDDTKAIQSATSRLVDVAMNMIILCGGTGLSRKDITPDAITPLLDTSIPGIMEYARSYGQERMPYAMLSRSVAGFIRDTLVLTFPGAPQAAEEYISALFPQVLHVFAIRNGERHE